MVQPYGINQLHRVLIIPGEVGALPKQAPSGDTTADQFWVVHPKPWPNRDIAEVDHQLLRPTRSIPLGNGGFSPPSGVRGIRVSPMPAVGQQHLLERAGRLLDPHLSKPPQMTLKTIPSIPSPRLC